MAPSVSTLAGNGTAGSKDGKGDQAQFNCPKGVAKAANGTVIVADTGNHRICVLSPNGDVRIIAGTGVAGISFRILDLMPLSM